MSLRGRLTLTSAAAVAVAIAIASVAAYLVVRTQLINQIDLSLVESAQNFRIDQQAFPGGPVEIHAPPFGTQVYVQACNEQGRTARPPDEAIPLPVTPRVQAVAAGNAAPFFANATVSRVHLRIYTTGVETLGQPGLALQVARPLNEVDDALARLRLILLLLTLGGAAAAAGAGMAVAKAGLVPVRRLTETAERVTQTGDLSQRIEETGDDEVGRLANRFNAMLDALQSAQAAQRQLVADASHELRTPLTSLRTNIEVLARGDELPPGERERLMSDVTEELEEFSVLVGDLMDLARGAEPAGAQEDVRLDEIVAHATDRARRRAPRLSFESDLLPSIVHGVPGRIDRAVSNLLDNAAKWSPDGGPVEVGVRDGVVVVRDHGPGIADEDLPHVFDRFYRSAAGRGMPGSGLGLAIVRQVAESHGGSVSAENAEGGGARLVLRFSATS
ncbi:MAG TPA: HAMP domain-containing sensor histidine kinase [Actinomycetota bacterium]|jgi:two-component system sensor histidine kinase MprB